MGKDVPDQPLSEHNHAFLARLSESSRHAVVMTARDGVIRSWNCGAEAIYRRSAADALGRRLADLTPDGMMAMRLHAITIRSIDGETWSGEIQFVGGDGRAIWVSAAASPMHDPAGRVIGTIWLAWDVTERKRRASVDDACEGEELPCVEPALR